VIISFYCFFYIFNVILYYIILYLVSGLGDLFKMFIFYHCLTFFRITVFGIYIVRRIVYFSRVYYVHVRVIFWSSVF